MRSRVVATTQTRNSRIKLDWVFTSKGGTSDTDT